jgi:pimeloyl-ACP methyl ester carboxylesterase
VRVVLLHALPLDERMWEPQNEVLGGHDVVAPRLYDLEGNSMDAWAEQVLERLEGDFLLVGASMGGYLALVVARRAPERVRGLLLEGSRPDADSEERRAGRADTIRLIEQEGARGLWESMRPKLFPGGAPDEVLELAGSLALAQEPEGLIRAVEAIRDRLDSTELARSLGARLRAVVGSEDPFVSGEELRALLGDDRVVELDGAGHLPSLERPAEFNPLLAELLRQSE